MKRSFKGLFYTPYILWLAMFVIAPVALIIYYSFFLTFTTSSLSQITAFFLNLGHTSR